MVKSYINLLDDAAARVGHLRAALRLIIAAEDAGHPIAPEFEAIDAPLTSDMQPAIYDALAKVDDRCAAYYAQAYLDLADPARISWIGTAHQVREAVATLLRTLAPDDEVKAETWFKPETKDGRPTHKQRVRHIMRHRDAGSSETEVVEQIGLIEERAESIGSIVRSTYSRASNAAHTGGDRTEARRILTYFEAFAHDLLDLD